ncbi:MAG: pantoate--beta-alanine ligase [Ferruginibacter sp.]|nr:pantoate--beta-alanine ligase [Ferruginibacter sp.]
MILLKYIKDVDNAIENCKQKNQSVGFVPTMGALHDGHISLIEKSKLAHEITICSIFVNPTQFNNATDLQKYPITLEKDIDKLEKAGCDILFLPSVIEMYPVGKENEHYELGQLEKILEGSFRPGHFQGVCIIVDKLLAAVQPTALYLGRKDYQQCLVIKKMMADKNYNIELIICDTVREPDGLAMSSRNMRLNDTERQQAMGIIESLKIIKNNIAPGELDYLKKITSDFLEKKGFKVDYIEIADAQTLELQYEWDGKKKLIALVAAYLNEVRLIDNIVL